MSATPNENEPMCDGLDGIYSLRLHIAGIFIILGASLIGAGLPILGRRVKSLDLPEYVYVTGKTIGTGVMLAVGFVHLIGDATQNFELWCVPQGFHDAFPSWAHLFAVVAVVLMHVIDIVIGDMIKEWYNDSERTPCSVVDEGVPVEVHQMHLNESSEPEFDSLTESKPAKPGCSHPHLVPVPGKEINAQFVVAAVCMEFGTTLHSLFVGMDAGVMSDDRLKPLLIALVFHQLFEGIAVGSRLVDAQFHISIELIMMLMFSFSAPLGAAVGVICVSASETALTGGSYVLVASILDSLCGGILVYLGLTLMLNDFPADMSRLCAPNTPHRTAKKIGLFVGLWAGAAGMCIVGKWC